MARLVWFVLTDGRSVVAGCGAATRDSLENAIAQPGRSFVLASDNSVEQIPASAVRDFVVFESKAKLPAATAIYRIVRV